MLYMYFITFFIFYSILTVVHMKETPQIQKKKGSFV